MVAQVNPDNSGIRDLRQEIYLLDLVAAMYRVYASRLDDLEGRRLLELYLRGEENRRRRLEQCLEEVGFTGASRPGFVFSFLGRLYGRVTSLLGTRVMMRIVLSASRRGVRRACALADEAFRSDSPSRQHLAALRARNEGELFDSLTQYMIDTRATGD